MISTGDFVRELTRVIALALVGAAIGWSFGHVWPGAALGILLYALWQALQLARLSAWLSAEPEPDPPESNGVWARVFDKLYHRQRRQRVELELLQEAANIITEGAASLSDGVMMVDGQGAIIWCNTITQRFIGVRCPQDQGNLLVNLLRDPTFVRYFQSADYDSALEIPSPTSTALRLRVEITVFGEGNRLLFIRDITMIDQLERMRVDFIANVSHELRTPLTVINGYLESLASMPGGVPEATLQRALAQMQSQSNRMQALVSDITLLSRLESEPPSDGRGLIDINALVTMLVDDARCSVGKELAFHVELDARQQLLGEEKAIHSAFGNLVVNACKYTPAGGDIHIRWYLRGEEALFEVEDNGVGVDQADIPHLTQRFYRVDKSRSTDSGGTGLGLAIVKHALLRHDAALEISSEPGVGSVFRCVFPAHRVCRRAA